MAEILQLKNSLDSKDMYGMIQSMPDHLIDGIALGQSADLHGLELESFHNIVVSGMGGSAIGGDIVRCYLSSELQIPFQVQRHYALPRCVNLKTLVICSSYSGNTEETISAYDNALDNGAKIVVISTGGKLGEMAAKDGVPLIKIKPGLPPRAALGYSVAPLLMLLYRLGLSQFSEEEIKKTAQFMKGMAKRYAPENSANPALKVAREIEGSIPIIYSAFGHNEAIGLRFKGQLSENSKCLAFANLFPEVNHNELVGWEILHGLDKNHTVIMFRDAQDHPRIKMGMEIVESYLRDKNIKVIVIESEGETVLERMFSLIQFGDYTSYYLALLNHVDPFPVTPIDYLKNKLANLS